MKLNLSTDYALRILIFLGSKPEELHAIETLSRTYNLSRSSLMKIVSTLVRQGYINSIRGRSGGIQLAMDPANIGIGDVVTAMDENFQIVDCSDCVILPTCRLKGVLTEATDAFFNVLCQYTLANLISTKDELLILFDLSVQQSKTQRVEKDH